MNKTTKIIVGITLVICAFIFDWYTNQNFYLWERTFMMSWPLYIIGFFLIWLGIFQKLSWAKWLKYLVVALLAVASFYTFAKLVLNL